jgi:hypothetical protein
VRCGMLRGCLLANSTLLFDHLPLPVLDLDARHHLFHCPSHHEIQVTVCPYHSLPVFIENQGSDKVPRSDLQRWGLALAFIDGFFQLLKSSCLSINASLCDFDGRCQ